MSTRASAFLTLACSLLSMACGSASAPAAAPDKSEPNTSPAPALAEAAAALGGTWHCSGSVVGPEGPSPSTARLDARLTLDRAWLRTELAVTSGKYPYQFAAYRTFEAPARTWLMLIVDNLGGHTVSRSVDGVTWTGTSSSPMGELKIRDSETVLAPGKMKLLGQYSLDGGASFRTGYELACER